jgi:hypothetical protein
MRNTITGITERYEALTVDMDAVEAILDCAKVPTALERSVSVETGQGLATGQGFADGHTLRDNSPPDLLAHGLTMVQLARNEAGLMREACVKMTRKQAT